jgi:hypothetical protein
MPRLSCVRGLQVQMLPYYTFAVTLGLPDVDDVLMPNRQHTAAAAAAIAAAAAGDGMGDSGTKGSGGGDAGGGEFEAQMLGSCQHQVLWSMLQARHRKLLSALPSADGSE